MSTELGKRRAEIMAFLNELSAREKLIVLTYLANDSEISTRIPNLARTVVDMHRAHHRVELLKLATDNSNLDLEFLARRKGCRLEPVEGRGDRWSVVPAAGVAGSRTQQTPLTRKQALDLLRSLPDHQRKA
jgi:hypothetical protein